MPIMVNLDVVMAQRKMTLSQLSERVDITLANAMTGEGTNYDDLASGISLTSEEYGVGFRKESDLTDAFNKFMEKCLADGSLQALADKYSLTLVG